MNGVDDGYKRPELSQGFFEIESIKRKRCKKGEAQYLVKWAGWPESANTWEPLENLMSCLDAVDAFENERTRLEAEKQRKKLQKGKRAVTHEQQHQDSPVAVARVTKEPLANPSSNGVRFVDRNSLMYVLRFQMMNAKERRKHTLGMKPWLCPPRQ